MYRTNLTNNLGRNFVNSYSPTSRVYNNLVQLVKNLYKTSRENKRIHGEN